MSDVFTLIILFIFGAALGSFACCQAWRLHLKEQGKRLGQRSVCLHCKYKLKWYDNIPIFSWLLLKGKCRKCKNPIGKAEILSELSLATAFTLVGLEFFANSTFATISIIQAILLLITLVNFWILLVYDAKWGRLPTIILALANVTALIYAALSLSQAPDFLPALINMVGAVGLLAGIYFLLYFFSKEQMVGGGDWLVCLAIALILGHWWLAILELFLANLLASVATLPAFIKKGRKKLYFGPFLIIGFVVIYLLRTWLMSFI
ncbi:prepilin peptidase [Candidatus Saccharibacteria bacterium]|nr:prepilin peptidase [Candidatus Saccharibacteria bacterium]